MLIVKLDILLSVHINCNYLFVALLHHYIIVEIDFLDIRYDDNSSSVYILEGLVIDSDANVANLNWVNDNIRLVRIKLIFDIWLLLSLVGLHPELAASVDDE